METVPLSGDSATIAGDIHPLFWGFDEMSNMIVHCISMYSCLQNLVQRLCCLTWVFTVFNAFVPAFLMVQLSSIMLVTGLLQEYGQDTVL